MRYLFFISVFFNFSFLHGKTLIENYLKNVTVSSEFSGLSKVDAIYVINLEKRPEKWNRMKKLLEERKLLGHRLDAVDGWKLSEKAKRELMGPHPLRIRPGQMGVILSHLSIIKDAYQRKFSCIWVMEDDLEFKENVQQLPSLIEELTAIDPYWDIFYTDIDSNIKGEYLLSVGQDFRPDVKHKPLSYYLKRTKMSENIMKIGQRFGAYSLLISASGIQKIWNYYNQYYLWTAYDIDIHYIPDIRQYSTRKDLVSVLTLGPSDSEHKLD